MINIDLLKYSIPTYGIRLKQSFFHNRLGPYYNPYVQIPTQLIHSKDLPYSIMYHFTFQQKQ